MAIKGFVESVEPHEIRGWAYDSEKPDFHLQIVAAVDGQLLGMTIADISRPDLAAASVGKGDYGFSLKMKLPLPQSEFSRLSVTAFFGENVALKPLQRLRRSEGGERPLRIKPGNSPRQRDASQYPVFILGTTRSGTSSISLGLLKSGRYAGAGEGHFLELLGSLLAEIDRYYDSHAAAMLPQSGTMLKNIPEDLFSNKVEQIFIELASNIFPNRRWVDKTPSVNMIQLSPSLLELWPNSKFIFMKRRGIENIDSKGRKFNQSFTHRCSEWAAAMSVWLTIRDKLSDAAIEIDQIDLATDPVDTANLIARHINLPDKYLGDFTEALAKDRPEMTSDSFPSILDFSGLSWTIEEKDEFRKVCGPFMESYGYTYDRKYRKDNPLQP